MTVDLETTSPFSVIVPAHDEESVLPELLHELVTVEPKAGVEVVVVCNGCSDGSAAVARRFGPSVRVIETAVGDKPHALALGDAAASYFPRFYIDADARTTVRDLKEVAAHLRQERALIAAPRLFVDTSRSGPLVKAYYKVWMSTPWVREELVGSGVYGVSEQAHARLGGFHEGGADDLWVSAHFAVDERRSVPTATFTVPASRSLREVVKRRARIVAANTRVLPDLPRSSRPSTPASLVAMLKRHPQRTLHVALYVLVQAAARIVAAHYVRHGRIPWNGDRRPVGGG